MKIYARKGTLWAPHLCTRTTVGGLVNFPQCPHRGSVYYFLNLLQKQYIRSLLYKAEATVTCHRQPMCLFFFFFFNLATLQPFVLSWLTKYTHLHTVLFFSLFCSSMRQTRSLHHGPDAVCWWVITTKANVYWVLMGSQRHVQWRRWVSPM